MLVHLSNLLSSEQIGNDIALGAGGSNAKEKGTGKLLPGEASERRPLPGVVMSPRQPGKSPLWSVFSSYHLILIPDFLRASYAIPSISSCQHISFICEQTRTRPVIQPPRAVLLKLLSAWGHTRVSMGPTAHMRLVSPQNLTPSFPLHISIGVHSPAFLDEKTTEGKIARLEKRLKRNLPGVTRAEVRANSISFCHIPQASSFLACSMLHMQYSAFAISCA